MLTEHDQPPRSFNSGRPTRSTAVNESREDGAQVNLCLCDHVVRSIELVRPLGAHGMKARLRVHRNAR